MHQKVTYPDFCNCNFPCDCFQLPTMHYLAASKYNPTHEQLYGTTQYGQRDVNKLGISTFFSWQSQMVIKKLKLPTSANQTAKPSTLKIEPLHIPFCHFESLLFTANSVTRHYHLKFFFFFYWQHYHFQEPFSFDTRSIDIIVG